MPVRRPLCPTASLRNMQLPYIQPSVFIQLHAVPHILSCLFLRRRSEALRDAWPSFSTIISFFFFLLSLVCSPNSMVLSAAQICFRRSNSSNHQNGKIRRLDNSLSPLPRGPCQKQPLVRRTAGLAPSRPTNLLYALVQTSGPRKTYCKDMFVCLRG